MNVNSTNQINSISDETVAALRDDVNAFVAAWRKLQITHHFNPTDIINLLFNKSTFNHSNNCTEHITNEITSYPNNNIIQQQLPPISIQDPGYSQNRKTFENQLEPIKEEKECKFLNPSAAVFIPTPTPSPPSSPIVSFENQNNNSNKPHKMEKKFIIKCKTLFIPEYPARAQLNIFIGKELTSRLLNKIDEPFPSSETLYYYIDITTALQINDQQMYVFNINNNDVVFVNYDLHQRDTGHMLYGVIGLNEGHKIKQNKWIWKLSSFMTSYEIYNKYGIGYNELPLSSRRMNKFQRQLETQYDLSLNISKNIIETTDWSNIQQIKSLKRNGYHNNNNYYYKKNKINIVIKINKKTWIEECKKSWNNTIGIPIVVNENKNGINKHWIEWIKLIKINNNNQSFGVSCKYIYNNNKWIITAINLDKGDILNKHRLIGFDNNYQNKYVKYFNNFNTTFTEIQWIKSN